MTSSCRSESKTMAELRRARMARSGTLFLGTDARPLSLSRHTILSLLFAPTVLHVRTDASPHPFKLLCALVVNAEGVCNGP